MNVPIDELHPANADVVASFDRAARAYGRHAHVQRAMAAWLAEWLPERRDGRAMEIAAGPGVLTERLLPWNGSLLATDISPAMCEAGRMHLPHVSWQVMAAESPARGPWDWIFCSSMLQWSADPARLLATWRNCLGPGGRVLAGLFIRETLPELRALLGAEEPVHWRTADEWRACLAQAGLNVLRDDVAVHVFEYPTPLALLRSLHSIGAAPVRRMSVAQLLRWARNHGAAPLTSMRATWTFFRFEAQRER